MSASIARRHLANDGVGGKDNFKLVLTDERCKDKNYRVILNYCRHILAYNFQTGNKIIKLLMEYENGTQKVL
jgi:hypothetical protein